MSSFTSFFLRIDNNSMKLNQVCEKLWNLIKCFQKFLQHTEKNYDIFIGSCPNLILKHTKKKYLQTKRKSELKTGICCTKNTATKWRYKPNVIQYKLMNNTHIINYIVLLPGELLLIFIIILWVDINIDRAVVCEKK